MISDLSNREAKLYEMIVERFLEALMPPHEYDTITVILKIAGYTFVLKEKCNNSTRI